MPPRVTGFMRQYPISVLEGTKGDLQATPPVISNSYRTILGELLTLHENPLPFIQTLEHSLKETSQLNPPPCPKAPATPLALDLLRLSIICVKGQILQNRIKEELSCLRGKHYIIHIIIGFVVLLFA
jgi:hypothetical protein